MKSRNFLFGSFLGVILVSVIWFVMSSPITSIRDSLAANTLKDQIQIIKDSITALGIVLAGAWAFYVFGLGRSLAPNVQIRFGLKQVIDSDDGKAAVISVRVRNNGKTNARKQIFEGYYKLGPKGVPSFVDLLNLQSWDLSTAPKPDPVNPGPGLDYFVKFNNHKGFEPGEEVAEEIVVPLGEVKVFKVAGILQTYPKQPIMFVLFIWYQTLLTWQWMLRKEKTLQWIRTIPYRAYFPSEVFDIRGFEQRGPSDLNGDLNVPEVPPEEAATRPGAAEAEARETQVEETGARADSPEPS